MENRKNGVQAEQVYDVLSSLVFEFLDEVAERDDLVQLAASLMNVLAIDKVTGSDEASVKQVLGKTTEREDLVNLVVALIVKLTLDGVTEREDLENLFVIFKLAQVDYKETSNDVKTLVMGLVLIQAVNKVSESGDFKNVFVIFRLAHAVDKATGSDVLKILAVSFKRAACKMIGIGEVSENDVQVEPISDLADVAAAVIGVLNIDKRIVIGKISDKPE